VDIIVTTPKSQMDAAAQEAEDARGHIEAGGRPQYFRRFPLARHPTIGPGDRVYYVEDGYIRGFAVVTAAGDACMNCETTGRRWGDGWYVFMDAKSWRWIDPVPMTGFQGFRYRDRLLRPSDGEVGDWRDPKPEVAA